MKSILRKLWQSLPSHLKSASYEQAERFALTGNITARQHRIYLLFWDWGAGRLSGIAAMKQERYYEKRGPEAYERRLATFKEAMR